MAIVKCKECGADVSDAAKACPKCGAPPPKPTSRLTWLALGCVVFFTAKCSVDNWSKQSADADRARETAEAAARMTPEQRAAAQLEQARAAEAKQAAEREFQIAVAFARTVRSGLKSPASFELTDATKTASGALCLQYRGTNSFNAIIPNYAVLTREGQAVSGSANNVAKLWNKHCAGQAGDDMTRIRHAL